MASDKVNGIALQHPFEAKIYKKGGKRWVTEEGKELEVLRYTPPSTLKPVDIAVRGVYNCIVNDTPTDGSYNGNDPLWRISHEVSRFATRFERISAHLPEKQQNELDAMLKEVSDGFHADAKVISELRIRKRTLLLNQSVLPPQGNQLDPLHSDQEIVEHSIFDVPPELEHLKALLPDIHYACVMDFPLELIEPLIDASSVMEMASINLSELRNLKNSKLRFLAGVQRTWHLQPLHIALVHGRLDLAAYIHRTFPDCLQTYGQIGAPLDDSLPLDIDPLGWAAYSSLECFNQVLQWLDHKVNQKCLPIVIQLAILGGNHDMLLHRIPEVFGQTKNGFVATISKITKPCLLMSLQSGTRATSDWFLGECEKLNFDPFTMACDGYTPAQYMCKFDWDVGLSSLFGYWNKNRGKYVPKFGGADVFSAPSEEDHMAYIAAQEGSLKCLDFLVGNMPLFQGLKGRDRLFGLKSAKLPLSYRYTVLPSESKVHFLETVYLGTKPLAHGAAERGQLEVLKWIKSIGGPAPLLTANENGWQPLHFALNQLHVIQWLYNEVKVDLQAASTSLGIQLVHLAALHEKYDVLDFLVSKLGKSCLNSRDKFKMTPLWISCLNLSIERFAIAVKWFEKNGADFTILAPHQSTLAHKLCEMASNSSDPMEYFELMGYLKENGLLTLEEVNSKGQTLLALMLETPEIYHNHACIKWALTIELPWKGFSIQRRTPLGYLANSPDHLSVLHLLHQHRPLNLSSLRSIYALDPIVLQWLTEETQ